MIARFWSARTTPALSGVYLNHFSHIVKPQLRQLDGFLGATVCTRSLQDCAEILVTTFWESFNAIEAFAGPDRESAVVAPEAAFFLTDYDRRVRHFEIGLTDSLALA